MTMNQMHLTEQDIATAAEHLSKGTVDRLDQRIRTHLAECDECANEVQFVSELNQVDDAFINTTIETNNKGRTLNLRPLWAAASILIVLGSVYWLMNISSPSEEQIAEEQTTQTTDKHIIANNDQEVISNKQDTTKTVATQPKPADKAKEVIVNKPVKRITLAYASNEELEALVKRFANNTTMRGEAIKVITPSTLAGPLNKLKLNWNNPDQQELIIEVYTNKGEKLFEETTSKNTVQLSKIKSPGLYYWKLIDEDFEMIFCGKIIVK
ncbi:hypothetical protein EYV94_25340 [Puteibacter caeruleilacunae]|nr:hypothetical protein EYV94_25340 [Puteibacter caeruleilacunae]